jgi:uncharacterized protein GlcG (DUF336 family)
MRISIEPAAASMLRTYVASFVPKIRSLRKPIAAHRAHDRQKKFLILATAIALGIAAALAVLLVGCGGGSSGAIPPPPPTPSFQPLTQSEVTQIITSAAVSASADTMVIAVADRQGKILGVFRKPNASSTALGNFSMMEDSNDVAAALARTAAFFSNNQAPLTSRTVRFISGIHLPPGVTNQPPADLYGIENTNRGCSLSVELESHGFKPSTAISGAKPLGIITGKKDVNDSDPTTVNPGGIPIYRGNVLVGGIGVTGVPADVAEYAAFKGATSTGFGDFFSNLPPPGAVFLGGVVLPAIDNTSPPAGVGTGTMTGGTWFITATDGTGTLEEGDLVAPAPGSGGLSVAEVATILGNAEAEANLTRASIRLPEGSRARMAIAVADLDGTIIGLRRMPDSTVFSIDVAATKARNMVYFNSSSRLANDLNQVPTGTAVTNRTIGFGAMPLFPPGIDGSGDGPFFNLYTMDTAYPCTQGFQSATAGKQSGIVFFPGSAGLYKNGVLVGGLGVSGDGVDQDDFVTSAGTKGFEAPDAIRADQVSIAGVRLPYFKFPRNPTN